MREAGEEPTLPVSSFKCVTRTEMRDGLLQVASLEPAMLPHPPLVSCAPHQLPAHLKPCGQLWPM